MSAESARSACPSRLTSWLTSATLVVIWAVVRLVVFDASAFPLTYALPLLVCIWTRDRLALVSMGSAFLLLHAATLYRAIPAGSPLDEATLLNLGATASNIGLATIAILAIMGLRERLEQALADVRAQADELREQAEELAQQNEELTEQSEELARQTEELTQQGDALASQNEELQVQSEEIGSLNVGLERRERLLETLLEAARFVDSERAALQHVTSAALELLGGNDLAAGVFERTDDSLCLRSFAPPSDGNTEERTDCADDFAAFVLQQSRTAALDDVELRPDLASRHLPGGMRARAVLCAPIRDAHGTFGAFAVYSPRETQWTDEQFRLAEWLASQCARILHALRVQAELRDADRRKSEFLATLSHELRNPLAPIRHGLTLLEQGASHDGPHVQIMQRQVQQLVRLVDDLLDATRLSRNKIQVRKMRLDLVSVVKHALDATRHDIDEAGHVLTTSFPAEPIWVDADPDRMAQVVTNLVNNAVRYTPSGGQVTIEVERHSAGARLVIGDTGVGIEPADRARVFEMFTQVAGPGSGGLGIGLALVRGIVELHGGTIEAHSEGRNRGSQFVVTLPIASAAATSPQPAPVVKGGSSRRVLVVDDNVDAASMMGTLLEMYGHLVWIAHDAVDALELAERVAPDVALLDIGLPGMNGYELARRLRGNGRTQRMRLVAVTGWGQDDDRARAHDAGFDAHVTKPAGPDAILAVL